MKKFLKGDSGKIRVKQIFGAHQIYQEIVNYPPEGVEYLGVSSDTEKGNYYEAKKTKQTIGKFLQKFKLPRMIPVLPGNFDIVHSSRGIIPITTKPWVMDIEHVHSFFSLNSQFIKNKFRKRFIEFVLSRDNCKAILCHCEATRQAFFQYLDCSKFKDKIQVLYPSSHIVKIDKDGRKRFSVLSVSSDFYSKAGPQLLKVYEILSKKYPDVDFIFRADVPEKLKRKYSAGNIIFSGYSSDIIPREELLRSVYSKADIFFYPTLADSFGYSLADAMIAKLPIVATNLFAVPEVVEDGKNGFIIKVEGYSLSPDFVQAFPGEKMKGRVEKKFIKDCVSALEKLIRDRRLARRMGQNSFNKISKGKFSIAARNKKLKKVYGEILR